MSDEYHTEHLVRKKGIVGFLFRQKAYIVRGHGYWLNLALSMINTILIIYGIGGTLIPWLYEIFNSILGFALIFIPIYLMSCSLVGRWDLKRGVWGTEQRLQWGNNPEWVEAKIMIKDINERLIRIEELLEKVIVDEREG